MIFELKSLQDMIQGEVFSDDYVLNYYSVDSSHYKVRPKIVAFPKNASDVINCVLYAKRHKLSVTARGGGTGLVGSALNDGIILDMKNLNGIRVGKNYVIVGPGVRKGRLDHVLSKHKKFLGPNPSVGPYCTIGGMIGTNASGIHSLKYGSTIDNLLEISIVTGEGRLVRLPSKTRLAGIVLRLAGQIGKYPSVSKNSCGYRLDAIKDQKDMHKIIAGSEGTLGIIISAKLKIYDTPKQKRLLILGYDSQKAALHDCQNIILLKPSAVEFIDDSTMKNFGKKFPKKTACLLFVEFDSDISKNTALLKKFARGTILYKTSSNHSITQWWAYRNAALHYSLKNLLAGQAAPHIIEDATIPVDRLEELVPITNHLRKKFQAKLVMYGHAGNGNIHVRVAMPKDNKTAANKLAREFFSKIILLGGTITGEHGDGIARTKFVKMQYGPRTYSLFSRLKQEFDPSHILNPNKIILG